MNETKQKSFGVLLLLLLLIPIAGLGASRGLFSMSAPALISFNSNLKYGLENNADVSKLQRYLLDRKLYDGPVTGNYFSRTTKAVKALQQTLGLPQTGEFDTLTRENTNALNRSEAVSATPVPVSAGVQQPPLTSLSDLQPARVEALPQGDAFTATDEIVTIDAEHTGVAFATWNSHLPKMAVGPEWSYALFSRFQADVNNRVAWVYKKKTHGGVWEYAGRVFNYIHQLPGIVLDKSGNAHIVFGCMPTNHACSAGGVNAQDKTRFYHLVFNGRNADGSVDFVSTFTNANEWTQESFGYMNVAVNPGTGSVLGVLATNADYNNHIVSFDQTPPQFFFVPKNDLTSKLAYTQFAMSPSGATFVATNELRRDWKSSAEYTGIVLYRFAAGAFQKVFSDSLPSADGITSLVFGSDMSFNQQGRLYSLYRKSTPSQKDCSYLVKEGLDGKFTAQRLPIGCLGSYPQLQIDSDNTLRIVASEGTKLVILSSEDDGASWTKSLVPLNVVAGTTDLASPTLVKPWSSPVGYDPDLLRGYYAGMDAQRTGWYAGTFCIPLSPRAVCSRAQEPTPAPASEVAPVTTQTQQVQTSHSSSATPAPAAVVPAQQTTPVAPVVAPAAPAVPQDPPVTTIRNSAGPITLSATPGTILSGKFSDLTLSAPNTTFCMIIGGAYGSGQQTSIPSWTGWTAVLTQNTAFTAQCTGTDGTIHKASVTIGVIPR